MSRQIDSLVIHGHTDNQGGFSFNMRLSNDRAATVKDYLLAKTALIPLQVITRGYGSTIPAADNETPEGRQRNRRVEIYVYLRE
jgi:outer membrane protein OmpA-like peptidoglycan-associated protein